MAQLKYLTNIHCPAPTKVTATKIKTEQQKPFMYHYGFITLILNVTLFKQSLMNVKRFEQSFTFKLLQELYETLFPQL